jgi:hypothetical protein
MVKPLHTLAALLALALAVPAPAAVLYKSVSPSGVLQFSDTPPEQGRIVERIQIPDPAGGSATVDIAVGPSREEQMREADAAVARANIQLDLAEHALAEARRSVGVDSDPMRLAVARMGRADAERIEFYKKNVLAARQTLLEVLQQKRKAAVPQTLTASNEWVALSPAGRR